MATQGYPLVSGGPDREKALGNVFFLDFLQPNEEAVEACIAAANVLKLGERDLKSGYFCLVPMHANIKVALQHRKALRAYLQKSPFMRERREWMRFLTAYPDPVKRKKKSEPKAAPAKNSKEKNKRPRKSKSGDEAEQHALNQGGALPGEA